MILLGGKSLSKLGRDLDGQKYYHKEEKPSITRLKLEKKINREFNKINQVKREPRPSFNTTSRQVKSPFILRYSKDAVDNKYQPLYKIVEPHSYQCQISKTLTKHQFDVAKQYATQAGCRRYSLSEESKPIERATGYKSLHHLDFDKQSPRKLHDEQKDAYLDSEIRFNNFNSSTLERRSRSFSSYTKRKELFDKKVHPLMINLRECKTHLFKKGWSAQKIVPFDKLVQKIKLRSDKRYEERPSEYNGVYQDDSKSQMLSQRSTFMSQTSRKPNLVKSQYHFRICL